MQSSEERVFISLDLESPNLNAKLPNNVSWLNIQEIKNNFIERNLNKLILSFNNQIPWNEKLNIENIYKFLNNGNDINILIQDYNFIGWAWQTKSGIIQDYDLTVKLKPHQIYQSKWLVDKKFLYNRQNKNLSLAWIQDLKKFYKKQGFTEGVAYIDSWNKGVLKSCLRSGYKIKNWT